MHDMKKPQLEWIHEEHTISYWNKWMTKVKAPRPLPYLTFPWKPHHFPATVTRASGNMASESSEVAAIDHKHLWWWFHSRSVTWHPPLLPGLNRSLDRVRLQDTLSSRLPTDHWLVLWCTVHLTRHKQQCSESDSNLFNHGLYNALIDYQNHNNFRIVLIIFRTISEVEIYNMSLIKWYLNKSVTQMVREPFCSNATDPSSFSVELEKMYKP